MRVLMIGWEFPPHISGGLGTACQGLADGLVHHGVDLTFVVPHVFGDERAPGLRLLAADEVVDAAGPDAVPPAPSVERPADSPAVARVVAELSAPGAHPRVLGVESHLRPYVAPAPPVEAGVSEEGAREEPEPAVTTGSVAPARVSLGVGSPHGHYGRDLFEEVALYARLVGQLAEEESFDLVHAHDWMTFPAGILAAREAGVPLVAHVHSCEFDRAGEHGNPRIEEIERAGMDAADRVVCVSHYTAGIVQARYGVAPDRTRVVHNAVTLGEQRAQWHQAKTIPEPVVLFLGRVTFQKGPDYFLEAAARVVAEEPNVRFVLGGAGDMLPRVIERAARMGLARHVSFTGFVTGQDVERIYATSDIYVMPSVSEPFGIAPLEAMALDVPVLVSRQSGVAEVLEHALTFDYWDVQDLAEKIVSLLREPERRRALGERGRKEVARLRWDLRGKALRTIYEELLA